MALTSAVLTETAPREEIFTLLHNASLAAQKMPKLESMALWHGKSGEACAVIYNRNKPNGKCKQATLTWRGTWDLELSRDVVESWEKAATNYHLKVLNERVHGVIESHGDAIFHLHLPAGVVDPVSLRQIRKEVPWMVPKMD